MSKSVPALSSLAQQVHAHDRDRFYMALFVPASVRHGLLALYALNAQLAHISEIVTEEMIGQVRLAWWQEAIDGLYAGKKRPGQPVLEALAEVIDAGHMPQNELSLLLESYREHFPELPPELDTLMEKISVVYLRLACPEAEAGWHKAYRIITRYRHRHGKRRNVWLALRLLMAT